MIGLIATLKIQVGQEEAFEVIAKELMAKVKANEPGCLMYQLFKSPAEAGTYVFMEHYSSKEALEAHSKTEYYAALGGKMRPLLAEKPTVQRLDMVE